MLKLITLIILAVALIFLITAIKNAYDIKYSIDSIENKKTYKFIIFNIIIAAIFVITYIIYGIYIYLDDYNNYLGYKEHAVVASFLFCVNAVFIFIASIVTKKMGKLLYVIDRLRKQDSLTKTYNRGYIEKVIANEYYRCIRYNRSASLIMLDVNRFKLFNDKYGHIVGDKVLLDLTNTLKSLCRNSDYIGRYGGDEFIIVLPETDMAEAEIIVTRIKNEIDNHTIKLDGQQVQYKVAIGTASIDTSLDKSIYNYEKWIQDADQSMYKSKNEIQAQVIKLHES